MTKTVNLDYLVNIANEFSNDDTVLLPVVEFIDTETDEVFMLNPDDYAEWAGDDEAYVSDVYFKVVVKGQSGDVYLHESGVVSSDDSKQEQYADMVRALFNAIKD